MQTIQIRLTKKLIDKAQELVDEGLYSNKSEVVRDALRRLTFEGLNTEDKRSFNIIFTADLHGNAKQYDQLFLKAQTENSDAIIIGGDIAPKDPKHRTIEDQKKFFIKELFPRIKEFKKNNPHCKIYIILGNDDFRTNIKILKDNESVGFKYIHNKCIRLHEDYKIAGYSYVPLTPYIHKDWEKLDLNKKNEHNTREGFRISGNKARGNTFVDVDFNLDKRDDTLEKDLNKLLRKNSSKTLFVCHSPPYNTTLDQIENNKHVGSEAVRKIISEKQPVASLHGHIHETVDISGKFQEKIGKTLCLTAGNNHIGNKLKIIKFNLYAPEEAIREII